MNKFAQI